VSHRRPDGASDELVEAVGRASEAFEYVERVRGHLYSLHQLMGRADEVFGDAADQLEAAGSPEHAHRLREEVVGRNMIEGRWTFQLVEEFDDVYYDAVRGVVKDLERDLMAGRRHVFESELKDQRRTSGRRYHEHRPGDVPDGARDHIADEGP
jgi:hypothetical protein